MTAPNINIRRMLQDELPKQYWALEDEIELLDKKARELAKERDDLRKLATAANIPLARPTKESVTE